MPRITRVKGLSEVRRIPRIGKIRLGVKVVNPRSGQEYPREVDYFVVPPEVAKVYGEKPKELDILLPVNNIDIVFPQAYKWYGSSKGVKCYGDGDTAYRFDEATKKWERINCSCARRNIECFVRAHLFVMLPKVSISGVYQIDIGSYNSIVDINSGLDYIQELLGHFAMVLLKLKRVPKEILHNGTKKIHYPLQITFENNVDLNTLLQLKQDSTRILLESSKTALPPIEDINPQYDDDAVVVTEDLDVQDTFVDNNFESDAVFENSVDMVEEIEDITPVEREESTKQEQFPVKNGIKESQKKALYDLANKYKISSNLIEKIITTKGITEEQINKLIQEMTKYGTRSFTFQKLTQEQMEEPIVDPF